MYQKLLACVESVHKKTDFRPEVGVVLGSGLGDYADGITVKAVVDYTDIPNRFEPTVTLSVNEEEQKLIHKYRRLTPKQRNLIQAILDSYLEL